MQFSRFWLRYKSQQALLQKTRLVAEITLSLFYLPSRRPLLLAVAISLCPIFEDADLILFECSLRARPFQQLPEFVIFSLPRSFILSCLFLSCGHLSKLSFQSVLMPIYHFSFCLSFSLTSGEKACSFFTLSSGPSWTRTRDLTLIRGAL